jgi:hypothetical protein
MGICAYCKQDRTVTREHVIPAFMYEFQRQNGGSFVGWNEVAQRMVGGEGKVKDVCAECNNTTLGALDAYGKQLLLDSGLLVYNFQKPSLAVRYDFDQLLRWLLKISFNSSRGDGVHRHLFEAWVPYILGKAPTPARHKVALLAYLASPEAVAQDRFADAARGAKTFNPFVVRISYGAVSGETRYTLRLNIFGPMVFHLLMFEPGVLPGHASAAIRRLIKIAPGLVEISPKLKVANLTFGTKSWLDLYAPQIARVHALSSDG